ncbi:hypothetical protein ACMFMG_002652 [Clarireedia jacksonii]
MIGVEEERLKGGGEVRIREDKGTCLNGKQTEGNENQGAESGAGEVEMPERVASGRSTIGVFVGRGECDKGSERGGCYCGCEEGLRGGYGGYHDFSGGKEIS